MKSKQVEVKAKKVEKIEPKRVQTAEGKRRAMLREMKSVKKRAA